MATNYDINYNDKRFTQVESQKNDALDDLDETYGKMIGQSDKFYQSQIDASKEYAEQQKQIQQEQTDFAIEKIEQQKAQAQKDYTKEQSGAYVDWQKQSNEYGANAEAMAAQGLANSGYSESSQVSMYNTYQNRVATAREVYNQAVLSYNNAITEARLQNNAALAEIAYQALQQQLELALEGFQYKNSLVISLSDKKLQVESEYYNRYQDVLAQINTENALAEEVRQYNESLAEERRQFNESLAEEKRQYDTTLAWQKAQVAGNDPVDDDNDLKIDKTPRKAPTSPGEDKQTNKERIDEEEPRANVLNQHGKTWVYIPGHGRFSWTEVYAYVKDGTIKETQTSSGLKYTWVGKKAKNVTPDAKGYAAKQLELTKHLYN